MLLGKKFPVWGRGRKKKARDRFLGGGSAWKISVGTLATGESLGSQQVDVPSIHGLDTGISTFQRKLRNSAVENPI